MSIFNDVYGLTYNNAVEQMSLLSNNIIQQDNIGFNSKEELEKWAHDHSLDKVVFSNMSHQFLCVSHKGEIMLPSQFEKYYGNILWYKSKDEKGKTSRVHWTPEGYKYFNRSYIVGEQGDGVHKPLYYRDYCVPSGYYSIEKDCFNVAKPFPVFAKETGADTSHVYTYIEHIAGECAMWLLAWLRAKLLYPTVKTQVVPIIVSRAQGSGKTTFAEVICKGLFGKDNVLVTDQYDSGARFNADYADALIVCQEEKEETDRRNPASALKSRATATTIRKEKKGIDPIYQDSYTDFIMTTNKDVPIKFDGREDQRRFMIMEADENFTRKTSKLADEVFTKLYGYDANFNKVGVPFVENKELIAQFKHELFVREDIAKVPLRNFPKTAAYEKCYTLPRTTDATEIEGIMKSLAPFIKEALINNKIVEEIEGIKLSDIIVHVGAMQLVPAFMNQVKFVALCRPLVFYEMGTMKPYAHSMVERAIYECANWLRTDYGVIVMPNMDALLGGFTNVSGRYRTAPAAKFCLVEDYDVGRKTVQTYKKISQLNTPEKRIGRRLRVNKDFQKDDNGCFETVNEMKPGTLSLKDKTKNVQYMDTFLFESDSAPYVIVELEKKRAEEYKDLNGENSTIKADELYKERLEIMSSEANRLFEDGIVARVVYSGAKSYHMLVRVVDAPKTLEEYKWLHAYLCNTLSDKLEFDASTSDPARLTRSPISLNRLSSAYGLLVDGEQKLICENWNNKYNIQWRNLFAQWKNRPLEPFEAIKGKPLVPTKPEYLQAMTDIIDDNFWDNDSYNGKRQTLFFPAYRLLRLLGYSHDEIWNNIILKGIERYKKPNDILYWKTRERSAIIRQIDADIDDYEESLRSE